MRSLNSPSSFLCNDVFPLCAFINDVLSLVECFQTLVPNWTGFAGWLYHPETDHNNSLFLQLAVDSNYNSPCPIVLYRANDDQKVFPRIHLDQVDQKHIYVPFQKQVGTLGGFARGSSSHCCSKTLLLLPPGKAHACGQVQQLRRSGGLLVCSGPPLCVVHLQEQVKEETHWGCCQEALSSFAQSSLPLCSCTSEDECQGSDWLSIPDHVQQKIISLAVVQKNSDQVGLKLVLIHCCLRSQGPFLSLTVNYSLCVSQLELIAQTHVSVSRSPGSNFTCGCRANSVELNCVKEASAPVPQCKCTLPKGTLPAEGRLHSFTHTHPFHSLIHSFIL